MTAIYGVVVKGRGGGEEEQEKGERGGRDTEGLKVAEREGGRRQGWRERGRVQRAREGVRKERGRVQEKV